MAGSEQKTVVEQKFSVEQLKLGMFVTRLDRSPQGTAFPPRGFWLDSPALIQDLQASCQFVYVDPDRIPGTANLSIAAASPFQIESRDRQRTQDSIDEPAEQAMVSRPLADSERRFHDWGRTDRHADWELVERNKTHYIDQTHTEDELSRALEAMTRLQGLTRLAFEQAAAQMPINHLALQAAIGGITDSIIRNPDALICLARLGESEQYTMRHCISSAIWALALGRRLGLPRADLILLGQGALYCDLGKARLPAHLLDRPAPLSHWEMDIMRQHVSLSAEVIAAGDSCDPAIVNMVTQHHENHDGSGYPAGLRGRDIDFFARIAAVADTFDALINDKCYRAGVAVGAAVRDMYRQRGRRFEPELMEEFIQAIGLYPAGTPVELSDASLAVVVGQSREHRLKPRVVILLDAQRIPIAKPTATDLITTPGNVRIARDLEPGAYDIDPISAIGALTR